MSKSPFADSPKFERDGKPAVIRLWPVYSGARYVGTVTIFDQLVTESLVYDGVTSSGRSIGAFHSRSDAALAIAREVAT
jgi:endonuclease YncB( thermonuclease family)